MPTSLTPILYYNPGFAPAPSTPVLPGYLYYWPQIKNLTGGILTTDLDAQNIFALPTDAVIEVVIPDRGASQWLRVNSTEYAAPPTDSISADSDADAGIIVPVRYDPITNPWILHRQLGY